jgi:type I restriction enzyme S subunit
MKKYNSYKPSGEEFIGDIPSNWECIRLGMLGLFSSSGIDKKTKDNEISVRMVNYTDIIQSRKYNPVQTGDKDYMVVSTPISKLNEHRLNKGDMVFIPSSETKEDLGYSSLIDFDDNDVVYSYHILRFRSRQLIYHYFKKYLVNHYSVLNQFSRESKGTTRQIIGRNVFNNVRVVLPPYPEQEQIVHYLDEKTSIIDKLISTKERKIELLKEQRSSLINQIITKGLNPNVKMKDSGVEWIGEIPERWEIKKMKYFVRICNGGDFKDFTLEDGGFPVYGSGGVFSRSSKFIYDKISVLLGRKGSVDKPKIVEEPFWCSDTTYYTKIKENVNPYYFFFLVQQIKFDLYTYGSTIPSMTKSVYDEMLFPYPDFQEQQEIVEYLDTHTKEIDDLVSMEQKKIDLLKEFRQSLISEVITGKIKVVE